ncbi:MAG: ABC transporter permease [Candidatus Micrarchaeia archaeon]
MSSWTEVKNEFWRSYTSKLGTFFIVLITLISLVVLLTMPLDFGTKYWSNPVYWVDNPKSVPPAWINIFMQEKLVEHQIVSVNNPTYIEVQGGVYLKYYTMKYDFKYERFPTFLNFKISNVKFYENPPLIKVYIVRPDNKVIQILTYPITKGEFNQTIPYVVFKNEPKRFLLSGDSSLFRSLSDFLYKEFNISYSVDKINSIGVEKIIFGIPEGTSSFKPLKGIYQVYVLMYCENENDSLGEVSMVFGGEVYSLMGTDTLGRDLFQGLMFGFPVALLIGLSTSIFTTIIGAILGIISGYIGGMIDTLIQRIADIFNNIPLLPLLIFFTFIFGGQLWVIVFILVAFGWPSLTIIVRSMILSLKSSNFIEAAIAIGASRNRIMVKHIFPQVAPFILAQLIFYTPSAILSESALSFLGLGDPSIPTWGQILDYAFRNGAVYLGYWWWVLPPGLLIIFSAVTFVLIALGLEPVVNPRLRRRR